MNYKNIYTPNIFQIYEKKRHYSTGKNIKPTLRGAVIYINADVQKLDILKDKGKSGIYFWVNKINGKTYIGSSKNLGKRIKDLILII